MNKHSDNQNDELKDDSVDDRPADPIEEAPDSEQAAEPVENVGEVIGRRNPELPLENPRPSRS